MALVLLATTLVSLGFAALMVIALLALLLKATGLNSTAQRT